MPDHRAEQTAEIMRHVIAGVEGFLAQELGDRPGIALLVWVGGDPGRANYIAN